MKKASVFANSNYQDLHFSADRTCENCPMGVDYRRQLRMYFDISIKGFRKDSTKSATQRTDGPKRQITKEATEAGTQTAGKQN